MRITKRTASLVLLGTITALSVIGLPSPAHAEVIEGPCTGSATFTSGIAGSFTVTESQPLSVITFVPDADTVTYVGNMNIEPPSDPVTFAGGVDVALPIPFRGWTVVPWDGTTEEVSASGAYTYSVPSWIPRGTGGMQVTARHTQQGTTCVVAVTMALDGPPGVAAIITATGAFVFLLGTLGAGVKKGGA